MKISDKAKVSVGSQAKRFETEDEAAQTVTLLNSKDFNEALGEGYRGSGEEQQIKVTEAGLQKLSCVGGDRLVIHLQLRKAAILSERVEGYIIPANFATVALDEDVYPPFFVWYFNHHQEIRKQIEAMTDSSRTVAMLKISGIKDLEMVLPSYEKQVLIGDIHMLRIQKIKLQTEINEMEEKLMNEKLKIAVGDANNYEG